MQKKKYWMLSLLVASCVAGAAANPSKYTVNVSDSYPNAQLQVVYQSKFPDYNPVYCPTPDSQSPVPVGPGRSFTYGGLNCGSTKANNATPTSLASPTVTYSMQGGGQTYLTCQLTYGWDGQKCIATPTIIYSHTNWVKCTATGALQNGVCIVNFSFSPNYAKARGK